MSRAVILALAFVALLLAACTQSSSPAASSSGPAPPHAETVARFIAIGDAGTGGSDQFKVARAIERVCAQRGCDFAVDLGDNIYDSGVSSANDPQFDSKFERPYANLSFPFYMVLGNHDNSGDPAASGAGAGLGAWYSSGDNEVAYAKRTDRASDKWTMPARYYAFQKGPVSFLALDTNTLVFDDVPVPPDQNAMIMAQTQWVDGAMAAAAGPWKIALGHHGYLSNGPHGNAGSYDGRPGVPGQSGDYVKSFFEKHLCGKIDLYLFGHDHDLQWLSPTASCGRTQFIGSGGGGAATYALTGDDSAAFQKQTLGFWWFEATPTSIHAVAFDGDGMQLTEGQLAKTP